MLDTSTWKAFLFGELIDAIYKGKAHTKEEIGGSSFGTPFVTRTERNNGVDAFAGNTDGLRVEKGGALVVGDTTATITYQPNDFICGDHMVVVRAAWINRSTGLFVATLLNNERYRYSYGRAFVMDLIQGTRIRLPAKTDGTPDWQWIEAYMQSVSQSAPISKNSAKNGGVDVHRWGSFVLSELFVMGMNKFWLIQ